MRYRLLIFDFDGTLADSFPVFLEHMHQISEHFGLRGFDAQKLDDLRRYGARELMDHLGFPAWKLPMAVRYMRRLLAADAPRIRPFPGILELLQRLTVDGHVLAIVSSNSEANVRAILGPEYSRLISVYACGASLFGKAAKFRRVLRHTRVLASETLTIGDEIRDLEAARETQIDFGAVSWGYTKVDAFRERAPAFVFASPEEILEACRPYAEP